ncbi:pyridoxine 5'-phosphate synthase [Pseudovibrio exalbescens]|uniref:pyridoxine 5'-phosphate synthase n=1 Tax=Pseudovibrio exalbescens TaxID=197461 RepID=UPI002365DA78|nr:pyridoxine 5'-phosphate synthase [Pseudovibrio exalbescens]MDD7910368.1 pyridoxine 5'-phosphate synthase [Pseudovibrio exalbescens]
MSTPSRLSVNVNAVAVLRNRRDVPWPSVTDMARIALTSGAKGITVHPRPDERHIRKTDVENITQLIRTSFPSAELCLEGYPSAEFLELVEKNRPAQVLYVPDDPTQTTSDHGWDFEANAELLKDVISKAKSWGVRTSLFVDPDPSQPALAKEVGTERIEIYTGPYGACYGDKVAAEAELDKVIATAEAARDLGLDVNAGHDLTVDNIPALITRAPYITEMSIGHGFVADSLIYGFKESVNRFRRALKEID